MFKKNTYNLFLLWMPCREPWDFSITHLIFPWLIQCFKYHALLTRVYEQLIMKHFYGHLCPSFVFIRALGTGYVWAAKTM